MVTGGARHLLLKVHPDSEHKVGEDPLPFLRVDVSLAEARRKGDLSHMAWLLTRQEGEVTFVSKTGQEILRCTSMKRRRT